MNAAEELERLRIVHVGADAVLTDVGLIDADWYAARHLMRVGWGEYQREWPTLVATATTPEVFDAPDAQYQVDRCPAVLLLLLGGRLVYPAA